jgi:polysaccharide pyruvyl transferase WcaK-like protein
MKVFFVGDNRLRANYGCRATSIALSLLLTKENEIVSKLSGRQTHSGAGPIFHIPYLPRFFYQIISHLPGFRKVWQLVCRRWPVVPLSFMDFVRTSPEKSYQNLMRCLPANPQLQEFVDGLKESEILVINGEGTFIASTTTRRDALIYIMYIQWAKNNMKPVFLVNTILSFDPVEPSNEHSRYWMNEFCKILKSCDKVYFRDPQSLEIYNEITPDSKNAEFVPDALFSLNIKSKCHSGSLIESYFSSIPFGEEIDANFLNLERSGKYIVVSGSSQAAHQQEAAKKTYSNLIGSIISKFPNHLVILAESCEGDKFIRDISDQRGLPLLSVRSPLFAIMQVLGGAEAFISGRYHPAIMASISGTPCIFLGSNSHKCLSLQRVLGYSVPNEYPSLPSPSDVDKIVNHLDSLLKDSQNERTRLIKRVAMLSKDVEQAYLKFQ